MECPVCYCSQASCKLACGHSFCHSCVKTWYIKCQDESCPSCPMCRKPIYFKGISTKIIQWDSEHRENMFQKVFEEHLEDLLEDVNIFTMSLLEFISERFQKMRMYDFDMTEDDIDYLIFNEFELFTFPREIRDVPTWKKFINISKHPQHPTKRSRSSTKRGYRDYPESFMMYILI